MKRRSVAAVRRQLERAGDDLVKRMVYANRDHLCHATDACLQCGLTLVQLRAARHAGQVIAYRSTPSARYVYPCEQFIDRSLAPWAADVVAVLGNGGAAIHFLYVARRSLCGRSLADSLRSTSNRKLSIAQVRRILGPLKADDPR